RRIGSGWNSGSRGIRHPPPRVLDEPNRPRQLSDASRGGEPEVPLHDLPVVVVVRGGEAHVEIETGGPHELADGLKARRGDAALEARDDGLHGVGPLGELRLAEPGALPGLPDQMVPSHSQEYSRTAI